MNPLPFARCKNPRIQNTTEAESGKPAIEFESNVPYLEG
jgi:hypothetical protein